MVNEPIDTDPIPDLEDGVPGDELPDEVEPEELDEAEEEEA